MSNSPDADRPEISDLVVAYDPETTERVDVRKDAVLKELKQHGMPRAARIVEAWPEHKGVLDRDFVDGVLLRSHLEMQRLSEEFQQGARLARVLAPVVSAVRKAIAGTSRRIRIVDVGCGLGYVTRWLAVNGELGDDVDLVGCDYNMALLAEAKRLARMEGLRCAFLVRNAFTLDELDPVSGRAITPLGKPPPATIFTSTGVVHHFRGKSLHTFFTEQARTGAFAFVHCDIKRSWVAPIGAWMFHYARMREPLARYDGTLSAVRAHATDALFDATLDIRGEFRLTSFDGQRELVPILKVMQAFVGVRRELVDDIDRAIPSSLRRRFSPWTA